MSRPSTGNRWTEHLRKHGPAERPDVLRLLLALAPYADAGGRTGYVDETTGELVEMRLAPCRECGLGIDG